MHVSSREERHFSFPNYSQYPFSSFNNHFPPRFFSWNFLTRSVFVLLFFIEKENNKIRTFFLVFLFLDSFSKAVADAFKQYSYFKRNIIMTVDRADSNEANLLGSNKNNDQFNGIEI